MQVSAWKDYQRTTGNLTWRLATPEDQPAIERIRKASERLLGEKQKEIDLFKFPILLALVADDAHGRIIDAVYVEAQVEIVKVGCTEPGLVETAGIEPELYASLRGWGFKTAIVRTRRSLKEKMSFVLTYLGLRCEDDDFSYWRRDL